MPIRTLPITAIKIEHAQSMIERRIREDRTLDYKEVLELSDSGKLDLLQDVTAMANASGGTILYGAVEGEGEDRGLIVGLRGMQLQPDRTELAVANLLRDNVDERIMGVEHRAVPTGDGTYLYVIRVPPSPRAPHMVTLKSQRQRFFLRGTVSNDPMNAQQIREVALRADTAYERARALIAQRVSAICEYATQRAERLNTGNYPTAGADAVALHLIPLFPPMGGVDLSPRVLVQRWHQITAFRWATNNVRVAFDGLSAEYGSHGEGGASAWTMLLRRGGLECVQVDSTEGRGRDNLGGLGGLSIELDILHAIDEAQQLATEGLLTMPIVMSLQLHHVRGLTLVTGRRLANRTIDINHVPIEPVLVSGWDEAAAAARALFHVMWQAWGFARSPWYNDDGTRIPVPPRGGV